TAWKRENAKTVFIISSSMEAKQLRSLITCETANEMWLKLSKIHEQKSASNKLVIRNEHVYLALFVNDGLIACKSREILDTVVDELRKTFERLL
ncbi:hypothetical protein ALC57_12736, partial [Trachymyrmex cornetzi]